MIFYFQFYLAPTSIRLPPSIPIVDKIPIVENIDDIELEDFMSYTQVVEDLRDKDELEDDDVEFLMENKTKKRRSWNQKCKQKEGMKHVTLIQTEGKGPLKAAHRFSTGKEQVHRLLGQKRGSQETEDIRQTNENSPCSSSNFQTNKRVKK